MVFRFAIMLLATAGLIASTHVASAALVRVDFNDLTAGDLTGQAGGAGVSGTWTGNATRIDVVPGDLTAPLGTNFELTQSGTALKTGSNDTAQYPVTRTLSSALTGDVWFSYLVNATSTGRGGIDLDGVRIIAVASQLAAISGGHDRRASGVFSAGQTSLVLGSIQLDAGSGGEDFLSLWVNPDVRNLGSPTLTVNDVNFFGDGDIDAVAVEIYSSTSQFVDLISLSDGPRAYADVTGIPEPSSLVMLLGLGGFALIAFVRRRRRN